ncbi:hypothetical protein AVEN_123789-1 [Araneus ventricosus]|uniref:Uncharacterized protein n=1 Tax=Araneus ventricosus TaxID=182803 RepID=A0A4Y2BMH9_ARAVE|nr:hypothetical protein AVEN_123789-1 [Araneus ventricosus]
MNKREVRNEEKNTPKDLPILIFDLQNVIPTPYANISSLFYLRKLNVYSLTVYYTPTKQVYCALWNENLSGRASNDIASALPKILTVLAEENDRVDNMVGFVCSSKPKFNHFKLS